MKGGCLRSDEDSCISGPDGSCELKSWTVCCSSRQRVFVDRLRCCWLIYTVAPSCASVVGTQYGPWGDIYQSSLYLVQHCQPVFTSPIHQGRPTNFHDHTGYTSWSSVPVITVHKSGSSSLDLLHTVYILGTVWIPYR